MNAGSPPDRIPREETIFSAAVELRDPAKRAAYLDLACEGELDLRSRVERMLAADEDSFFDRLVAPAAISDGATSPAEPARAPESVATGEWIGRYKLLQKIGEGGMGVVYMAEQEEPVRRRVALKIIKLGMDTHQVVARFEAERQALAMMDHPNIARVLDGGATDTGRPYFVMELVQGVSITEFCDKNKVPARERLKLFTQVCQAIQSAHQKGIIHRDIKPSNVLVTLHHGEPCPKVIDFGIAKATNQKLTEKTLFTQHASMIGTPAYMSPEQAEMSSLDVDTRTDVYALGVLLYELLTGTTPFPEKRLRSLGYGEMQRVILNEEPERPSTRLSTLNNEHKSLIAHNLGTELSALSTLLRGDLDWIVMKCLEKDRRRRYETASSLAADIERHLRSEAVLARPPSTTYRFQKLVRRNKLAFCAAFAVATALLVGLGLATWQAIVANRAREMADAARAAESQERSIAITERNRAQAEAARAEQSQRTAERNAYAATMSAIQAAWDNANITHVRELLDETGTYADKGFEWYYWHQMLRCELLSMREHEAPVTSACYSPDGSRIASGSADHTVRIWDAASGQVRLIMRGHSGEVSSVAFSTDGRRLVTAAQDGTIRLWDADSAQELGVFPGRTAILSHDGTALMILRMDGRGVGVNLSSGRESDELDEQEHPTRTLVQSPTGNSFLSVAWDGAFRMWSWDRESRPALLWLQEPPVLDGFRRARPAAFSRDGERLVVGGRDRIVRILDGGSGRELMALAGQPEEVEVVAFAPNGLHVASASSDRVIRIWDARKGEMLLHLKGHEERVLSLAFSPDGLRLASASADGTVKVWDASRAAFPKLARAGKSPSASGASVPPISGFEAHLILSTTAPAPGLVVVRFSPDGRQLLTAGKDHFARLWDASSLAEIRAMRGGTSVVSHANFSPDARFITTGSHDGSLRLWDASSGEQLRVWKQAWAQVLWSKMTRDRKRILSTMGDGRVRIWDVATGDRLLDWQAHETYAATAEYSLDEQRIATCGRDGLVRMWEASTGKELLALRGHEGLVIPLAFSADGKKLVTGGIADRTIRIWDAANGRELQIIRGHLNSVWDVNFSRDGSRLTSASADGTVRLWDAANGRGLLTLRGHVESYMAAILSPDETRLACAGSFPAFEVWDRAASEQVTHWQEEHRNASRRRADWEERAKDQRDRAQSHRIKSWLVLMGVPLEGTRSPIRQLRSEQLPNEAMLQPRAGETAQTGRGELVWKTAHFEKGIIDFDLVAGATINHSMAGYAVCYVRSDKARRGLRLKIGASDQARLLLNGKPVYEYPFGGYLSGEVDTVAGVDLRAGLNVVVLKMIGTFSVMQATLRFVDDENESVQGLAFSASPD